MVLGGFYVLPKDPVEEFKVYMRRQGWTITKALTQETDPRVLRIESSASLLRLPHEIYTFLERKVVRKLLRALLSGPQTRESLLGICSSSQELDAILARFVEEDIAVQVDDHWEKGPVCANLHDFGPTLEWMVAEAFRWKMDSPAHHGVTIKEVPRGGDFDVVALVNNLRVWVECKSTKPESVSNTDLRLFLQRAQDFNPEMAVLLIDTDGPIDELVGRLNRICADMDQQLRELNDPNAKDRPQSASQTIQRRHKHELWWGRRNIFVTNVVKKMGGIDAALTRVLRLYHSEVRHYIYLFGPPEYAFNYVKGRVTKLKE